MKESSYSLSRREFLKDLTSLVVFPSFPVPQSLDRNNQSILEPIPEAENVPRYGDVLASGNEAYLLKPEGRYLLREGIDVYNRTSGANEFGSRAFVVPSGTIEQIPLIPISPLIPIDNMGDAKAHRSLTGGGQKIMYGPGFMHDAGELFQNVRTNKTFREIQDTLEELSWTELDRLYFTYGAPDGFRGYDIWATMRDFWENVRLASSLIGRFKKQFPLERFDFFGDSLGGAILFFALADHLEIVNNIVLLNSPVLGLPDDIIRRAAAEILKRFYSDKVAYQLLDFWNNIKHKRRVLELTLKMKQRGVRLYTFGTEGDFIVPPQSAILIGSEDYIDGERIEKKIMPVDTSNNLLFIHRRPLIKRQAPKQFEYYKKITGKNFAAT